MASLYKRGNVYYAQWYRPDGKHMTRSTGETKKREAERVAAEMENKDRKAKSDTGRKFEEILARVGNDAKAKKLSPDRAEAYLAELRQVADPNFRTVTLAEHLREWCEGKAQHVSPSTAAGYEDMRRRFTARLDRKALSSPLAELTRQQIEKAARKMKADGLKGSTVNLDIRAIRQCLKQAMEDGTITRNPAAGIRSMPEDDSEERAPFTATEVRAMMDHVKTKPEWKGMVLFGAHTGLRLRDVASMDSHHIEGTDIVIRPGKTKRTKKLIRIPLTPPLLAWIAGKEGAFFPVLSKKKTSALSMEFRAMMKRAGVPDKVTLPGGIAASRSFHSLRHSFASWLAEADIHADVRQKLTGHSTAGSHAIYTHHDAALKRAIDTLPNLGLVSDV